MERVNKEIKRRTDFVGVLPNPAAQLCLAGAILIEQHDEWDAGDRRYLAEESMLELATVNLTADTIEEVTIIPELATA